MKVMNYFLIIKNIFIKLINLEETYPWEFKQSEEEKKKISLIIETINRNNKNKIYDKEKDIMKDTFILFDNTKENKSVGKIKGSYDDILIGYTTLIYQTAIKNNKKPEDVVLDILNKV